MKKSWFLWVFIVGIAIAVFVAFNLQNGDDVVPLSEIFPEEESYPIDVEYEFIEEEPVPLAVPKKNIVSEKIEVLEVKPKEMAKPVPEKVIPTASPLTGVKYTIQIASFKKESKAKKVLENLKEKKIDAFIVKRNLGERGIWYRVYVGTFDTMRQAKDLLTDVRKLYRESFIISPKK